MDTDSIKKTVFLLILTIVLFVLQFIFIYKVDMKDTLNLVFLFVCTIIALYLFDYLIGFFDTPYQKRLRYGFQLFFDERKDNLVEFQKYCIEKKEKENIQLLIGIFDSFIDKEEILKAYNNNAKSVFLSLCKKVEYPYRSKYRRAVKEIFESKGLPKFYDLFIHYKSGYLVNCDNNLNIVLSIVSFILTLFSSFNLFRTIKSPYVYITIGVMAALGSIWTMFDYLSKRRDTNSLPITECNDYNELVDTYKAFCGEEVEKKILY